MKPPAPVMPVAGRRKISPLSITAERDAVVVHLAWKASLFEKEAATHESGPERDVFIMMGAALAAEALAIGRGEHRKP